MISLIMPQGSTYDVNSSLVYKFTINYNKVKANAGVDGKILLLSNYH